MGKQYRNADKNSSIKLVIFDLDGVLVDACEWHRSALNAALKDIADYEISLEDHYHEYNGIPTKIKLQKLVDKGVILDEQKAAIYELKQEKTIEVIKHEAKKRQEKIDMLEWLKEKDIRVACYTNSIRLTTKLMLEKTGIIDLFDLITTNQDVKKPKPDPEGYLETLRSFNTAPHEALIIEDSPKGMQAAIASGCHVIQVNNPEDVDINLFREYIK